MNWLKVNSRRMKEGIMQTVGAHQGSTPDLEFDAKVQAFQTLVRDLERFHEAMIVWSDCIDALSMAGAGLGDSMAKFFSMNSNPTKKSALDSSSKAYLSVTADINEVLRGSVHKTLTDRCLRPTAEILEVAPVINEKLSLRKQLLLDYDHYRRKYENRIAAGKDESDPELAKIANKMRNADKTLVETTSELVSTFEEIEAARSSMLIPEVSALVGCHHFYMQTCNQMLSEIITFFPESASTSCILHADKANLVYPSSKTRESLKIMYVNDKKSTPNPPVPLVIGAADSTSSAPHDPGSSKRVVAVANSKSLPSGHDLHRHLDAHAHRPVSEQVATSQPGVPPAPAASRISVTKPPKPGVKIPSDAPLSPPTANEVVAANPSGSSLLIKEKLSFTSPSEPPARPPMVPPRGPPPGPPPTAPPPSFIPPPPASKPPVPSGVPPDK